MRVEGFRGHRGFAFSLPLSNETLTRPVMGSLGEEKNKKKNKKKEKAKEKRSLDVLTLSMGILDVKYGGSLEVGGWREGEMGAKSRVWMESWKWLPSYYGNTSQRQRVV